jgi:hypothetical protein
MQAKETEKLTFVPNRLKYDYLKKYIAVKVKLKFTSEQVTKKQRWSSGIALLFI